MKRVRTPPPPMRKAKGAMKASSAMKKKDVDDAGDETPSEEVTIDVPKKRPSKSSSTDPSSAARARRSLPCWFDGPLNDSDDFAKFTPKRGDILQVIPLLEGDEAPAMTVEVIHADRLDELGVLAILKFLHSDDKRVAEWGKKFVTGSTMGDVSSFHFCRARKCRAGDDNTLHLHKWKFVDEDLDGDSLSEVESIKSDKDAGGVKVFDAGKVKASQAGSSTMRKVAELRARLANIKPGVGTSKPSGSGGAKLSKMALSLKKITSPSQVDASPSIKASGAKVTVAGMLAGRAAERAEKAASTRNALLARKKDDARKERARGSADSLEDEISVDRSGDEREDDDGESVFRKSPSLFRVSRILSVASRSEGTLMQNGVQLMSRALSVHQRGGDGLVTGETQAENLQDVVTTYLTTAMIPGAAAAGQHMGIRTIREMRTLAESLDAIIRGEPAKAGDILMQRFRACETNVLEGDWSLAKHLELIPPHQISSVPMGMRQEMVREQNLANKLMSGTSQSRKRGEDRTSG